MSEAPSYPTIVTSRRVVPNVHPVAEPHPYRIALIGEAPGEDEENYGIPFVGRSGQLLNTLLRDVGIDRNKCFVGNICSVRPPGNEISRFEWDGPEIQSGLSQLSHDLHLFNPNICVLIGNTPLRAALGRTGKISDWCGSLFRGAGTPFLTRKCIPAFHPAGILREWGADGNFPRTKLALQRALQEGSTPDLSLPNRELITNYDASTLCRILDEWPSGRRCSLDIEGGLNGWPCVSICSRPEKSITIAWGKFSEGDHGRVLRAFARLMARTDVPKVLQNSLYDNFVLSYGFGIPIRNVVEDTMLKGWEVYCELPKSLGCQASIWTREPFYKAERKSDEVETFYRYCAKDSAVTLEICNAQDSVLTAGSPAEQHYRANIAMLNPLLYMQVRGINYDQESVTKKLKETREEIERVGEALNEKAKVELRGEKGSLSAKRLSNALYNSLGYPPQYKKEAGRKSDKLTTDVEAILNLKKRLPDDAFLANILQHRHLEGILETLEIRPDTDGRIRCGYNVVGTETGRLTCYISPTGAGANLQTITKKLRVNYRADPGYDFFQCDLSGADGWTVAAHCARLGDPRMLEDYRAGLKPAKLVAGLYVFGSEFNELDTESLRYWGGKVPFGAISSAAGSGIYDCSKVVQHGSNYLMGIPTMQTNVMKKSFKETGTPIYMEHADARRLQDAYFTRYSGVRLWHSWAESTLVARGQLTSASGHTRIFFGRRFGKDIHDTVKQFLADEPQQNTTWATNLAMLNLWRDPANRVTFVDRRAFLVRTADGVTHYWAGPLEAFRRLAPGSLLIEPLHQVHDALCGQWPTFLRDWARARVKSYFNNTLTIAGIKIIIPFEGQYGPSWGDLPHTL